jgi:putative oxidoreductase
MLLSNGYNHRTDGRLLLSSQGKRSDRQALAKRNRNFPAFSTESNNMAECTAHESPHDSLKTLRDVSS